MTANDFPFFGNALWVDFINTEPARPDGRREDLIASSHCFERWAHAAQLVNADSALRPSHAAMEDVLLFRTLLREGAENLIAKQALSASMVATVNEKLALSPLISTLVNKDTGWDLASHTIANPVAGLLGTLAADFANTLVSGRSDKLRKCEHHGCVMLFIDTSKNGKRRWCSMETCGNREKAAGHRARSRRSTEA